MLVSLSGSLLSSFVWYRASDFSTFLIARTLGGLFEGNVSIALTVISQFDEQKRKKSNAFVGVAYSLAFIFGPLIGVKLSYYFTFFYQMPAIFQAVCSFSSVMFLIFFYDDQEIIIKREQKSSFMSRLCIFYFFYLFAFSGLEFALGFLFLQTYAFTRAKQGKIYATIGLIMCIFQGGLVRKRAGIKLAVSAAILFLPAGFLLASGKENYLYVGLFLKSITASCVVPSANTVAGEIGIDIGTLRKVGAAARALGPIVFCSVYWIYGGMVCFNSGATIVFITAFVLKSIDTAKQKQS